ncbi:FAD-dependent oxidoreductase, partial [Campylobacter coli]
MTYDIAVIGSGSVGSFAGYYAAKMGLKTCLVDKFQAPHTQGSYHGDTRIFRIAYGEGEKYIPLLQEAYTLWGEFEKEQNIKLFERCGLLNIGSNSTFMQNVLSSVKNYDLKAKILNAKELQENYNICVSDDFFGVLETDTGFVYSDLSVKSAINAACKLGAHTLCDEIVRICKENGVYKIQTQNS